MYDNRVRLQLHFASDILIGPATFFAKLSLLLLYLRIFAPQRHMRYLIYLGIGFGFCIYWVLVPIEAYFCAPAAGQSWDPVTLGPKCLKSVPVGVVQGPLNTLEDIFILVLPISSVMNLHLPLKRKLQVLGIFMTGILYVSCPPSRSFFFYIGLAEQKNQGQLPPVS